MVTKYCVYAFGLLVISLQSGYAAPPSPSPTPRAESELSGGVEALIINAQNVSSYKNLVVPELYSSIRAGNVELLAASKAQFLPEVNELVSQMRDPKEQPNAFLGLVTRSLGAGRILSSDFTLTTIHENRLSRTVEGRLLRIYPQFLSEEDKTGQLFREKLRLVGPKPLAGISWVTFRFDGSDEDVYWVYSPAIRKSRQLTGSNRTDGMLTSRFSLDDLFTWSGKRELTDGQNVSRITYLVPFADVSLLASTPTDDECVEYIAPLAEERGPASDFNVTTRKFPQAAPWLPTSAVFIPRDLIRIELESRDPYSIYGRQILYVDIETLLPVYKFVFDRSGHPWKTVMTAYGWMGVDDKGGQLPVPVFTVVDDALKGESFVFEVKNFQACKAIPPRLRNESFDPRRLGEVLETPSPSPTSTPVSGTLPTESDTSRTDVTGEPQEGVR